MIRLGFLYPGAAASDDYPLLAARTGTTARLAHTSVGEDAHEIGALLDLGDDARLLPAAERVGDVDAVVWACTSGSFVRGLDGARAQARRLADATGLPASSTTLAYLAAIGHLGIRRVSLAASYPAGVTDLFVRLLTDAGVEVVGHASADILTAEEVGRLRPETVVDLALDGDRPDAEAVLLPDTAMPTAALLDDLGTAVGKPVLTANQVTYFEALRLAGHTGPTRGLGVLSRA